MNETVHKLVDTVMINFQIIITVIFRAVCAFECHQELVLFYNFGFEGTFKKLRLPGSERVKGDF